MQVTINGQNIDFTLEAEQELGQVVSGLEKALNDQNMVVTSLRLGDRELAAEPEAAWSAIRLDSVDRLDVTASPLADLERDQLAAVGEYLGHVQVAVAERRPLPARALEGFADAAATARLRLDMSTGSPAARRLADLEQILRSVGHEASAAWPEGIRGRALDAIAALIEAVRGRLAEIETPLEALRSAAAALEGCSRDLTDVSLMLQTGQQEKAMGHVTRFAALLQTALRSVARLGDPGPAASNPLSHQVGEMNAVLKQAVEALEARDTVLLGDLLEYEIAPRLKDLSTLLGGREA